MSEPAAKRILLLDDEKDIVEALQYTIEDEGFEVVTATDEEDALAKVAEQHIDAAVLDVTMGGIGGAGVAQRLRASAATALMPIVILSGLDESEVRKTFTDYDLFVSKGADVSDLGSQLGLLIERRQSNGTDKDATHAAPQSLGEVSDAARTD